jgi:hypothetical protein
MAFRLGTCRVLAYRSYSGLLALSFHQTCKTLSSFGNQWQVPLVTQSRFAFARRTIAPPVGDAYRLLCVSVSVPSYRVP